jgi:hypothetical protein
VIGQNFPVDEYLRRQITDARTISKKGPWWTAVLLFEDPDSKKRFLGLYKWNKHSTRWHKHSSFRINSKRHLDAAICALQQFSDEFELQ